MTKLLSGQLWTKRQDTGISLENRRDFMRQNEIEMKEDYIELGYGSIDCRGVVTISGK